MNWKAPFTVVALLGAAIGFAMFVPALGDYETATANTQPAVGRFQIATFDGTEQRSQSGYHIVDTATGQVWTTYGHEERPATFSPADVASNQSRLESQVKIFSMVNGDAQELAIALRELFPSGAVRITFNMRKNAVVACGPEADLAIVEAIVARLDEE